MQRSGGFTLIELLVVISIMSLMISILLPALSAARHAATAIRCASDQRQLFFTIQMYSSDYNDLILPAQIDMKSNDANVGRWQVLLLEGGYIARTRQVIRFEVSSQLTWETSPTLICPAGPDSRYRSHVVRDSFYPDTGNNGRMWVSVVYNGRLGMIRNGAVFSSSRGLTTHAQVVRPWSDMYNFDCGDRNITLVTPSGPSGWPLNREVAHPGGVVQAVFLDGSVAALGANAITVIDQITPDGSTRIEE